MKTLFSILLCSLFLNGCITRTPVVVVPVTPTPVVSHSENMTVNVVGAVGTLTLDGNRGDPYTAIVGVDSHLSFSIPFAGPWGEHLTITADGYQVYTSDLLMCVSDCEQPVVTLIPEVPAPPTHDQALLMNLTFQGLTCHTDQFGDLNWFEPAISWLTPSDRQKIYACKKAAGDTHLILGLPGGWPLYNECCNDFSPDRFGPLDWTAGETKADSRLADLVIEVRQAGLIPVFFSDETNQPASLKLVLLAIEALQHSKYGDITNQVGAYLPGWDGVFYGWEPSGTVIPAWASSVHAVCPTCRLGIEFNAGHIPIGGGPADWAPGGRMVGYDLLLGSFNDWVQPHTPPGDQVWQIIGRLVSPYHWPADEPANEDSHPPPFYLTNGTVFCAFETGEYLWVRHQIPASVFVTERAYFKALGVRCTG